MGFLRFLLDVPVRVGDKIVVRRLLMECEMMQFADQGRLLFLSLALPRPPIGGAG